MTVTTIVATVFVFGLLIFFHELGHFITAKLTGMRVDEFAVGFGPKLLKYKRGETLYTLRIIPLGGFNKIAGMDPDEEQDERSYSAKPIWARMVVIIAGSAMNFLLPVVLFVIVFLSAGIDTPSNAPVMGSILADKPAARAGLAEGDTVISVNGATIRTWRDFVAAIQASPEKALTIRYERGGQVRSAVVTPEYYDQSGRAVIGVMPQIHNYRPGFFEAFYLGGRQTFLVAERMVIGIGQMITGRMEAELAGPIGVAQMAGQVAQMGFIPLLQFAAFLSINLGLINLLPVPALDGGHVVTLAVEGARGKPLSRNHAQMVQMIGFVLLVTLMIFTTFQDITRWTTRG